MAQHSLAGAAMATTLTQSLSSSSRSRSSRLLALLVRVRGSAWGAVGVRVGAVVVALVVLGWIGRTAAAGSGAAPASASLEADASSTSAPMLGAELDASTPALAVALPAASSAPAGATTSPSRARATPTDPVFLNHASVDELRRLPGVGAKRAEAILVLRQRVGRFQRVEDLLRVKGVGRGAVKKWRPLVRLDSPSAPDAGSP